MSTHSPKLFRAAMHAFGAAVFAAAAAQGGQIVFKENVVDVKFGDSDYTFGITNINVGADYVYDYGVYGQLAKVANIESFLPDTSHFAFANTNIGGTYVPEGCVGGTSTHSSEVSSIMAALGPETDGGYSYLSFGIAPMATLYAAAVATEDLGNGRFSLNAYSVFSAYKQYFITEPVDVINSSYGAEGAGVAAYYLNFLTDAFARAATNTLFCVSAGNTVAIRNSTSSVGAPALGYNNISVGALGNPHDYDTIWNHGEDTNYGSARGPADFYNPLTQETVAGVRAAIDITAPGENIVFYDFEDPEESEWLTYGSGTSYASPIVAGTAALLVSVSRQLDWGEESRDARLIKAVLLNSADKPADWNNGASYQDGVQLKVALAQGIYFTTTQNNVYVTTQSLDYTYGAGILNAEAAFDQYVWDSPDSGLGIGEIELYEHLRVDIGELLIGDEFSATLVWFAEIIADLESEVEQDAEEFDAFTSHALSNLDLELWMETEDGDVAIAISMSVYNAVEHIFMAAAQAGEYYLKIVFNAMVYGELVADAEAFAIAWNIARAAVIPESARLAAAFGIFALLLAGIRRKRR